MKAAILKIERRSQLNCERCTKPLIRSHRRALWHSDTDMDRAILRELYDEWARIHEYTNIECYHVPGYHSRGELNAILSFHNGPVASGTSKRFDGQVLRIRSRSACGWKPWLHHGHWWRNKGDSDGLQVLHWVIQIGLMVQRRRNEIYRSPHWLTMHYQHVWLRLLIVDDQTSMDRRDPTR